MKHFCGTNVKGKDVIVANNMIASGGSIWMPPGSSRRWAQKWLIFSTFGLFTSGLKKYYETFDKAA